MCRTAEDIEKEAPKITVDRGGESTTSEKCASPTYDDSKGFVQEFAPVQDGIELHPKPTADPLDPLNFSKSQKWVTLAIVMAMYFMFTYITTTTVPSFMQLMDQYSISFMQANWTVAIPALGLSVGPLIWSAIADIYGRRLVFIVGTSIAFVATIGSAVAPTYSGYMAARFFQGLGVAPGSTVGMAIVNDLFFEHERGQKLGLWVLAIDMGLLVGPLIGGFVTTVNQFWVAWLCVILFGILLVAELLFLPETLYPRSLMLSRLPTGGVVSEKQAESYNVVPRTKGLGFINLKPVPGIHAPKVWDTTIQFMKLFTYPNVSIMVVLYSFAWYWWILSVITYLPVAYSTYKPEIQGVLFIGLILGTLISEIFFSGHLSDKIMLHFSKKNNGIRSPEHRLWLFYPAVVITSVGLILWGISVDKGMHWMVGQVAFFLFAAGIQMGNTVCSSYIVDCYPKHAMSVVTFYAVLLNFSAFANPFFIATWVNSTGFTWTFATQGMICFFVMVPCTIGLQMYGEHMRNWKAAPSWISPEYST